MSASGGPPWSSTITSWIMVSSRWVFGSSNGIRLFSARRTTNQLSRTAASAGVALAQVAAMAGPSMPEREKEPEARASTRRPKNRAGSARQEKVASRALPIPSKAEPVSSAAAMVKNRPRPST